MSRNSPVVDTPTTTKFESNGNPSVMPRKQNDQSAENLPTEHNGGDYSTPKIETYDNRTNEQSQIYESNYNTEETPQQQPYDDGQPQYDEPQYEQNYGTSGGDETAAAYEGDYSEQQYNTNQLQYDPNQQYDDPNQPYEQYTTGYNDGNYDGTTEAIDQQYQQRSNPSPIYTEQNHGNGTMADEYNGGNISEQELYSEQLSQEPTEEQRPETTGQQQQSVQQSELLQQQSATAEITQ